MGSAARRDDRGRLAGHEQPARAPQDRAARCRGRRRARPARAPRPVPEHRGAGRCRSRPASGRAALAGAAGARPVRGRWLRSPARRAHARRPGLPAWLRHAGDKLRDRPPAGARATPVRARLAARLCWTRHLAMGTCPSRLPARSEPADAGCGRLVAALVVTDAEVSTVTDTSVIITWFTGSADVLDRYGFPAPEPAGTELQLGVIDPVT